MKLYASGLTRSRRVLWAFEELGASCEVVELQFPPKDHHPEFLAINPAGAVPALIDGDVCVIESLAIIEYVSRKLGGSLTVDPGEPGWLDYLQLLHFGESTLAPPLGWIRRFRQHEGAFQHARETFTIRAAVIEKALSDGREFLAAGRLTAADLSVGFALDLAEGWQADNRLGPLTRAYRDRLRARPAFRRAYA